MPFGTVYNVRIDIIGVDVLGIDILALLRFRLPNRLYNDNNDHFRFSTSHTSLRITVINLCEKL